MAAAADMIPVSGVAVPERYCILRNMATGIIRTLIAVD